MKSMLLSLLLFCVSPTLLAESHDLQFEHAGVMRSYLLYVPSSHTAGNPAPLLMALHGRGGTPERMAGLTGFNARAERHGFIVVYPQGLAGQWNYLHGLPGFAAEPDDSAYLSKLAEIVAEQQLVDPRRIYLTGISNGGFMVQRLACHSPRSFAAFAAVAASGYATMPTACDDPAPTNMLYLHGTEDSKVPWQGLGLQDAQGNRQRVTLSVSDSMKFWSQRNACGREVNSRNIPSRAASASTRVRVLSATKCADGVEVELYAIIGGGHNWPGETGVIPPHIAGSVNLDIHASDVIWEFFADKRLPISR